MNRLIGRTVYLDSNVFVYAVEHVAPYAEALRPLFVSIRDRATPAVTSALTRAETLVKPFRLQDDELRIEFESALADPGLSVEPVSEAVLIQSARLRSVLRLKLPDAIHAATAQLAGCEVLLTNDTGLAYVPGVEVVRLSDVL